MYLAAAEGRVEPTENGVRKALSAHQWDSFPVSRLSHHNATCCEMAREWLRSMDFAQLNGAGVLSGPRWLRERYEWGPSGWPFHWCEAVGADVVDCGAHAALAQEVFEARGATSFRAQFVQQYNSQAIEQWRTIWDQKLVSSDWLGDDCIYHEGNAVLIAENTVKLWDGSASSWINPFQARGYGSLLSLRLSAPHEWAGPDTFLWGSRSVTLNEWNHLDGKSSTIPRDVL